MRTWTDERTNLYSASEIRESDLRVAIISELIKGVNLDMPRPTNKSELIKAANDQWEKMWKQIDLIPGGPKSAAFDFADDSKFKEAHWKRDKNMRDVFIHLYEWHQLLLDWTSANLSGGNKSFLPEPYTWKTYSDMNTRFQEKGQSIAYEEAEAMLRTSHAKVMALIESLSDDELFSKKHFLWTGTTNIGAYCISAAPAHYEWAIKKVKRYIKDSGLTI